MDFDAKYKALLTKIYAMQNKGIKLDLANVSKMLAKLGNPQNSFKALHIAGTNGKGSAAAMTESILRRAGYKTGVFTSPHLAVFNERIKIDNQPVAHETAYDIALKTLDLGGETELTFFEIVTVMAFCVFAAAKVDYAVLETGMGGRLDATNVVTPEVALITNVTLEHTQWLGDTVAQIAFEKAGIIKPRVPVVTAAEGDALNVIQSRAEELNVPLSVLGFDFDVRDRTEPGRFYPAFDYYARAINAPDTGTTQNKLVLGDLQPGLAGSHQIKNAACAIRMVEYLNAQGAQIMPAAIRDGLALTRWPGRLEILSRNPLILLDGAHNLAGMQSLAAFIKAHNLARKLTLVAGILADKAYGAMLDIILPLCQRVVFTRPYNERALNAQDLLPQAAKYNLEAYAENDIEQALNLALRLLKRDETLCVSGSLYLVGVARELLLKHNTQRV